MLTEQDTAAIDKETRVVSAYDQVKAEVKKLRVELSETSDKITALEGEIEALPKMRAPFEDLKAGLLDIAEAGGKRYAEKYFKAAIIDHATGGSYPHNGDVSEYKKPMTLGRLVSAIETDKTNESMAFFIRPNSRANIDQLFYALFFDVVKNALTEAMRDITPQDLGYSKINPGEIGPTREVMQQLIAEKQERLDILKDRRKEVVSYLTRLGIPITWKNGRPE